MMFSPNSQFNSTPTSPSSLDGPPPHSAPRPAGADTNALQGKSQDAGLGSVVNSPRSRVTAGIAMAMQSINLLMSVAPGYPPLVQMAQMVDQISKELPDAVEELSRMPDPMSMMSGIGAMMRGPGGPGGVGPGGPPAPSPILTNPVTSAGLPGRVM